VGYRETPGAILLLHTGCLDQYGQKDPEGIDEGMAITAFDLLLYVKAADSPLSVVLTG
jgi:hypothetical protein